MFDGVAHRVHVAQGGGNLPGPEPPAPIGLYGGQSRMKADVRALAGVDPGAVELHFRIGDRVALLILNHSGEDAAALEARGVEQDWFDEFVAQPS
jgi:hypothetical protein